MNACGTWPIGWPSLVSIETARLSNGNCERLAIRKRHNYYVAKESTKGWTAYVPKLGKIGKSLNGKPSAILSTLSPPLLLAILPLRPHIQTCRIQRKSKQTISRKASPGGKMRAAL